MDFYKVSIILFTHEGFYDFKTKYFSDKKLAIEYFNNLENFRNKFLRVLKLISDFFDKKESEGMDTLDICKLFFIRHNILYNNSNYDFTYNDCEVRLEEIKVSNNTIVIYKEE